MFSDFFFLHDGEPIAHLVDEATSFSVTLYTQSRSWEHTIPIFLKWREFLGHIQRVSSDQEGCIGSDPAGFWLERRGTRRRLVGRAQHLPKVEKHNDLIETGAKLFIDDCRTEGIVVAKKEALAEVTGAKNQTTEFGGFSPSQAVLGKN